MTFKFNPFSGNFDQVDPNKLGLQKVRLFDPVSTTLPSGASATIDGVSLANGDLVLFSNLSSNNNRVYKASGVGSSIVWTAQKLWSEPLQADPVESDLAIIEEGDGFATQIARFDGTNWKVNEVFRMFDGANYQELSSIKKSTLTDNTTTDVIDVNLTGSENFQVFYSIVRGSDKEIGQLLMSGTGSTANLHRVSADIIGDVGITFDSDINAGNIRLRATATSTGTDASMTYWTVRWSDSIGGPSGTPNYASAGSATAAAGSVTGEIQLRGSDGNLAVDSEFVFDSTNNELQLGDLKTSILSGNITLNDNQAVEANVFTLDVTQVNHAIAEYSIVRDTSYRTGRMLIVSDGTNAEITTDHVETSDPGITFSADVSGTDLRIRYTSTSTGSSGTLKYSIRKWI